MGEPGWLFLLTSVITLVLTVCFFAVLGGEFLKYMEAFKPFLGIGLKNYAEYQVVCAFNRVHLYSHLYWTVIMVQSPGSRGALSLGVKLLTLLPRVFEQEVVHEKTQHIRCTSRAP